MTGWQWLGAAILAPILLMVVVAMCQDPDVREALGVLALLGVVILAVLLFIGAIP